MADQTGPTLTEAETESLALYHWDTCRLGACLCSSARRVAAVEAIKADAYAAGLADAADGDYCARCGRHRDWSGDTAPGAPCMGCGRYPAARQADALLDNYDPVPSLVARGVMDDTPPEDEQADADTGVWVCDRCKTPRDDHAAGERAGSVTHAYEPVFADADTGLRERLSQLQVWAVPPGYAGGLADQMHGQIAVGMVRRDDLCAALDATAPDEVPE